MVTILLVDDDVTDCIAITKAISDLSAEIVEADTGEKGLALMNEQSFDCVLLDHVLPDIDSKKYISRVRKDNDYTPIIVITGHGDERLAVESIKNGASDYLPKSSINDGDILSRIVQSAITLEETTQQVKFYEYFYNTAPIGFYTTRLEDGYFLNANPQFIEMLGFDSLEELQDTCKSTDLYSLEDREKLLELIQEGPVTDFEVELHLPNGQEKWVTLSALSCDSLECLEGSVIDITEKKEMQAELNSYKKKGLDSLTKMGQAIEQRIEDSFLSVEEE